MAGKATSVYVTVSDRNHKTIVHKQFFNAKDANVFMAEMAEKYPKPDYFIIKETY
jgi:hypothetical protein